jgi:hypothetical protein
MKNFLKVNSLPSIPARSTGVGIDPRAGGHVEKRAHEPQPVVGAVRQTKGEIAYHGGVTVDDLPNVPLKSYEKKIEIHPGMTAKQTTAHATGPSAKAILKDAANLGGAK